MLSLGIPKFLFDAFTGINFFFSFLSACYFCYLFKINRYLIIKPSFLLLLYTFLFFQLPLPFYAYECEKFLPNPYILVLIVHGFVLLGLFLTSFSFVPQAQDIWRKLSENTKNNYIESDYNKFLNYVFSLVCVSFLIYCCYVNLKDTPLVLLLNGGGIDDITLARESTLKTLNSSLPKYAYAILRSCFAQFVIAFGSYILYFFWKAKRYIDTSFCLFMILISILFSLVVLNKSILGIFLVSIAFNIILANIYRPYMAFLWIIFGILSAFIASIFLTGIVHLSVSDFFSSVLPVFDRVFAIPLKVGTWYIHYEQTNDFIGIASIPKISKLMNIEPINLPNFIGKIYGATYCGHEVLSSYSANAGFIFNNHLSFGIIGFPISLLMLFSLDIALPLMRRLPKNYLIPFISVLGTQLLSFTASDYGVCMVTHGYGISLLIMYLWVSRKNIIYFFKPLILRFR